MHFQKDHSISILTIVIGLLFVCGPLFMSISNENDRGESEIDTIGSREESQDITGRATPEYMEGFLSTTIFYAGDKEEEFSIRLGEDYGAEEFDGDNDGYNPSANDDLFNVTVTIREFRNEEGKTIPVSSNNPFSGFASGYGSAYNNNGDGYPIAGTFGRYWYANEDNDDFKLNLKTTVVPGDYTLYVIAHYKIRIDYDEDEFEYIFDTRTEDIYIPVEVVSGLSVPVDKDITIYSNGGTPGVTLYAGASLQLVGVTGVSPDVGKVGGITGSLSYSGNEVEVPTIYKTASLNELETWENAILYWRINVKENAAPGFYDLKLSLAYTRNWDDGDETNDISITENSINLKIKIDFSPLLSPPDSNDLTAYITQLNQEDEAQLTLEVTFTNGGNVDLTQIEVLLDLSNARYFYTSDFYYDEDNNAAKVYPGTEKSIDTLNIGDTETVTFVVGVRNDIPPGKYIIPITYDAKYFDTGVFGASSIDKDTDENEYNDILTARGAKEPDDEAYIFVLVEDSLLDMEATTNNRLQPGMIEANLQVNLQNVDGYDLTDLNITIPYNTNLPIVPSGGKEDFEYHLMDALGSGWNTFQNFVVNVKEDARLGIHDIPVKVECLNELEEKVTLTVTLELEIIPVPPEIVVAMVESPKISSGTSFDLKVTVMNIGGSKATNITVQLFDDTNMFESAGSEKIFVSTTPDLGPTETHEITYRLKAHKIKRGMIYNLTARAQYKDSKGNLVRYSQSNPLDIELKTKEKAPAGTPFEYWLQFILGILFLAVIILFPLVFFRFRYKARKKEMKRTEKKEGKQKKKEGKGKSSTPQTPTVEKEGSVPSSPPRAPHGGMPAKPEQSSLQWNAPQTRSGVRPPQPVQTPGSVPRPPTVPYSGGYDQRLLPEHPR